MKKIGLFSLACLLGLASACSPWRKNIPCCPPAVDTIVVEDQAYAAPYAEVDPYYAQVPPVADGYPVALEEQAAPVIVESYATPAPVPTGAQADQPYGYSEELDQVVPVQEVNQDNMYNHPNHRNKAVPTLDPSLDSEVNLLK